MCDSPRPLMPTTATRMRSLAPLTWDQERGDKVQTAVPANEDFKKFRRERAFIGWLPLTLEAGPWRARISQSKTGSDLGQNGTLQSFSLCFCERCGMDGRSKS